MEKPDHILTGDNLRELSPRECFNKKMPRLLRSSVTLPSQYQSYAVCVEFAKEWFLDKFAYNFFNSIYVDGKHSFDEFKKYSDIDQKLRRVNPILAIIPSIDMTNNRNWIDSMPEIPLALRRSRFEGTFFHDLSDCNSKHLQIIFKTILMNFTFKMRVDTRAEELDLFEFVKLMHRAGYTETQNLTLDIHVPREIIAQIAYDQGFKVDDNLDVDKPLELLRYLNAHSFIPFIYKLRCANGNKEFFIKVPNCVAHIRSEMPSMDDGERQNAITKNYTIDFNVEIEMTAPYAYTYYSQCDQKFINTRPINSDGMISVMRAIKTEVPDVDEHKWKLASTTEYMVDESDLGTCIDIDFKDLFKGSDIQKLIDHANYIHINPSLFINIKLYNDGLEREYHMDWNTLICHMKLSCENETTVIGIYLDMDYVNNTLIQLKDLTSSRLH